MAYKALLRYQLQWSLEVAQDLEPFVARLGAIGKSNAVEMGRNRGRTRNVLQSEEPLREYKLSYPMTP